MTIHEDYGHQCHQWGFADGYTDEMHNNDRDLTGMYRASGMCRAYRDGYQAGQVKAATDRHHRLMAEYAARHPRKGD